MRADSEMAQAILYIRCILQGYIAVQRQRQQFSCKGTGLRMGARFNERRSSRQSRQALQIEPGGTQAATPQKIVKVFTLVMRR
jgi:hypothetical protein